MTFEDYIELKNRAESAGMRSHLHLIQARNVAKHYFEDYMRDMNKWQRACFDAVVRDFTEIKISKRLENRDADD